MKEKAVDLRQGWIIQHDGRQFVVLSTRTVKSGTGGGAFIQTEMRNIQTGSKAQTVEPVISGGKQTTTKRKRKHNKKTKINVKRETKKKAKNHKSKKHKKTLKKHKKHIKKHKKTLRKHVK